MISLLLGKWNGHGGARLKDLDRRFLEPSDASHWSSALHVAQEGDREDTDRYQDRFKV